MKYCSTVWYHEIKNPMVLHSIYLDLLVYALILYISLNILLYIKPDNTYVLIWSFQYGPLEPCWFRKDSESKNIWFMKLIDIVIFWLKKCESSKGKGLYWKMILTILFLPTIGFDKLISGTANAINSSRNGNPLTYVFHSNCMISGWG